MTVAFIATRLLGSAVCGVSLNDHAAFAGAAAVLFLSGLVVAPMPRAAREPGRSIAHDHAG